MVVRPDQTTAPVAPAQAADRRSDYVRAAGEATSRYLAQLMGAQGVALSPAMAAAAQHSIGNQATAQALAETEETPEEVEALDAGETAEDEQTREDDEDEEEALPDADRPAPADPADEPGLEDEGASAAGGPPPNDAPSGDVVAPPSPAPAGGAQASGAVVVPSGGGAAAVARAATQTAASMPGPPLAGATGTARPARRPRRRPTRRQVAGPPPVPTVDPEFTDVPDPVKPATDAIETIAGRRLPPQTMPDVPASPGDNTVPVPRQPLSPGDRRLVRLGVSAMNDAGLSRTGGTPLPEEAQRGEAAGATRTRLLALRESLLNPQAAAPEAAAPTDATPDQTETPSGPQTTPAEGAEQADAEAVASAAFTVASEPLPSPTITVAEQEMFTSVLANLKAGGRDAAQSVVDRIKREMKEYPGGVLARDTPSELGQLGKGLVPDIEDDMDTRVGGVAELLGTAGATLDAAVADRRRALATEEQSRTAALQASASQDLLTVESTAQARLDDAATAEAQAAAARQQARDVRRGAAPTLGFRETAEGVIRTIQAKVSEAIAGFQFEKKERHDSLDAAKARWKTAVELAAMADQFDVERARGLTPGATHPPDLSRSARRAINRAVSAAQTWKTTQNTYIDTQIRQMKGRVDATIALNIRDVQNAGADAFRSLRDWGNTQDGAVEGWWQTKVENLDNWASNASDTANTWAQTESRLARLQMQRAAERVRRRIEGQISQNEDETAAYQALTEGQRRNFIARNIQNSTQLMRQIGAPMQRSQYDAQKPGVERTVEVELFALPRTAWRALDSAAKAKNAGFSASARANKILAAGYDDNLGTEEDIIFRQLSGLRKIERLALTAAYNQFAYADGRGENALYRDLDGELSGDEWRRAKALMRGDDGEAVAEAIHDAVYGAGTSEGQIFEALETVNRLPEPDRTRALTRADQVYRQRYGQSLASRIREDMSGSEGARALAMAAGNMREAEAHEMQMALGSHDANAAAAVYARIRSEEMVRARREGWTPAEFEAAVFRRNQQMSDQFQEHYAGRTNYNWGSGTALENAVGYQFAFDDGNRNRLRAFQAGDMVGVSAGRMQGERRSFYADDEAMGSVVTAQYTAAADVVALERGPELRRGVQRRVALEVRRRDASGSPMTAEQIENYRMGLDRQMNATMADAAFDHARSNVTALDSRLQERYGITLDNMISNTMSDNVFGAGGDLSNARSRIEIMRRDASSPGRPADRRLDWAYTRVRHSIEGAGTDMPELRGGMSGLTRAEMRRLDARWQREHGGETLRSAIQSDTSGRDEDDLVDLFDHGAPTTVAEQVDEMRRKLDRDEASVGFVGAWASENQSSRSREELAHLEAMARRMRDPSLTPQQRENITASFNDQKGRVGDAIQAQRDRVDSYADTVTTVLGYVVSAVVIVVAAVATVLSGGTLSPALGAAIALSGSIVGTVSGIAAKAAIKGGAYGMEELGTDIAVGLVDLAVTMATAGLFKGGALFQNARVMLSGVMQEVNAISRQSIRVGLRAAAQQTARATAREGVSESVSQRLLGAGRQYARSQAIDAATAIPTTMTANLLNEQNWRHGNVGLNVMRGTLEASLTNLRDGVIMGAAGNLANRGVRRMVHTDPFTPTQVHERNLRHWRHANPGASPGDFARYVESYAAANSDHADVIRSAQRHARRALLSEIPPRERRAVADVPIIHVNGTEFRRYNKGNFGDAFVHVQDGQAVIIVRDGAPASAIAGIGPALRDIVAPGTRGRTVNPTDALPQRLRNRVEVSVVNDPTFGVDEVRAVPQRDRSGNITGVALQVGPNARAIDIQLHVGTVDAMRRYAGLSGRVRMFMNRIARRMNRPVTDPTQLGAWEASLEVAKLPRIIEERMARLSERGLDPRRRALVMEQIASLEAQFMREVARADLGGAAEARGFVAAQAQGDLTAQAAPLTDAQIAQNRAEQRTLIRQIRVEQARLIDLDQQLLDAQGESHSDTQNALRRNRDSYARSMRELRQHLPAHLHPDIDYLSTAHPWPPDVAANHSRLAADPAFAVALAKLGKRHQNVINTNGVRHEIIAEFHRTRVDIETQQRQARDSIDAMHAHYATLGGDSFMGVQLHPDLPPRQAPDGYMPEFAFEPKLIETLGTTDGRRLMDAIVEYLQEGQSQAFDALLVDPTIAANLHPKTVLSVYDQIVAHRQGYRAELSLASQIAEGIPNLPGDGPHTVLDFGDPIGANQADVISIDAEGNVFMWDSKYRSDGPVGDSGTFTNAERRAAAAADVDRILNDPDRVAGIPQDVLDRARDNIDAGTYYTITSNTSDVVNFTHRTPMRVVNGVVQ